MRTRHLLAVFTSGCMALAGVGTANAQPPSMPTNGNPDQAGMGMLPSPYSTAYAPTQPYFVGANGPGYPPGPNQWPNVSPFAAPPVDSTTYQNGFWFNQTRQGNRRYYGSVEAIFGHGSKPGTTLIGAPNVNQQTAAEVQSAAGTTTTTTTTVATVANAQLGTSQFNQFPLSGPAITATGTTGGGGGGGGAGGTGVTNLFPSQNTGVLPDNLYGTGVRGTWGWWNTDDTGFVVSGFMQTQSTASFALVDPNLIMNPNTQGYNDSISGLNPALHAWFGLPLAGADTDNTSSNGLGTANDGAVIPYDMGVHVSFSSRLAGANTDWYFNAIYERDNVKLRPLAGARYIRLQENFEFDGYDSGMAYTVTANSAAGGGGGGGGAGGAATTTGGYLTPATFTAPFNTPNVIHSRLTSSTLADMGGPEIGLRLDLGGNKFQFWTQTSVGALANVSQRNINGFGIGNAFNITTVNGILNTVPVMPNDPSKTGFSTSQTTTTMTPMFEQQFNTKMPIFSVIPYVNKMEIFERANLTAGYTFLYLQDVYRPQNAIIWNQFPNAPQLNSQKSNYYNSMFNIGVEWTY